MQAARLHEYTDEMSEGLTVESVDRPTIERSDGVLIEVLGAGWCQTDNHIIEGMWADYVEQDLPRVEPHFQGLAGGSPAADRIEFRTADFFADQSLPAADVYILGHILHDWGLDEKREVLSKVYDAVNDGGAVIVYGTMIDDERREAELPLLMSLNMLIETPNGFDYTPSQLIEWLTDIGFDDHEVEGLPGPDTMVVGRK